MHLFMTVLLLAASNGIAQANCKDPQSNAEMKICADQDLKKADADLNVAFDKAIAGAREADRDAKGMPGNENRRSSETMLREAQRAWIAFRDANCNYQFQIYYGGTHAGLAYLLCKADMTKARLKELRQLPGGDDDER